MDQRRILRILDANFNRSREGLRVCEDVARFIWEDRCLSDALKKSRHAISGALKSAGKYGAFLTARDSAEDVGSPFHRLEARRRSVADLYLANLERVKESLRVLEEMAKLIKGLPANRFKHIRFEVYEIEKKSLPRLETVRHHRSKSAKTAH